MTKLEIKKLFSSILFWMIAGYFFIVIRTFGLDEIYPIQALEYTTILPQLILVTIVFGVIFYFIDLYFPKIINPKISYGLHVIIKSSFYFGTLLLGSILFNVFEWLLSKNPIESLWFEFYKFFISQYKNTLVVFLYFSTVFLLYSLLQEINKKLGPGILFNILIGRYYKPTVTNRIFMFIDLKSSTTYAEKLGHIKYSELIQDCFDDITVLVSKYKAEIYQYVGDEIVLTWPIHGNNQNLFPIKLFRDYLRLIEEKSNYYQKKYGIVPEFKSGANAGTVTIAEVGRIKREIAYHGDAINTAARIQQKCGELNKSFLISEKLKNIIDFADQFSINHIGEISLKGKNESINIYEIK